MNWLDILLGVVLAGSTISGIVKGFARTVIGITATILGFILALWFYPVAGSIFADYVSSKAVSNFLGFIAVSAGVILLGALLGRLLAMAFKWAGLSWLDRTLGACFGALRGMLAAIVIVMILMAFSLKPPPQSVVDSAIAPYVLEAAHLLSKAAPNELTKGFLESYDKVKEIWQKTFPLPKRPKAADY